jgi:hypothetical protein
MSGWFAKNLGDAMLAAEELERIERAFAAAYAEAGRPSGMGVFIRHESEGRLHCEVKAYFPPAAAALARAVDAEPCGRPSAQGLSLLAGDEAAWATWFPDRRSGEGTP